jgi:hypothetical protein
MTEYEDKFSYKKPKEDQIDRIEDIRVHYKELARFILDRVPEGRDKNIAKTKLEESCMWAIKAEVFG